VFEMTRNLNSDVSFNNRKKFSVLLEETRAKVAAYLKADPYDVALVRNSATAWSSSTFPKGIGPEFPTCCTINSALPDPRQVVCGCARTSIIPTPILIVRLPV
jgi:hypothetical protein